MNLAGAAAAAGLRVLASAHWPETDEDDAVPELPGFVVSSFSPLAAEVARRCLDRHAARTPAAADLPGDADPSVAAGLPGDARLPVTAVVVASALGDVAGAVHVAGAVDGGARLGPLLFFQAVPNAVAGHLAARRGLTGPVVCVGDTGAALGVVGALFADGDAGAALLLRVDQASAPGGSDRAAAVLLAP